MKTEEADADKLDDTWMVDNFLFQDCNNGILLLI